MSVLMSVFLGLVFGLGVYTPGMAEQFSTQSERSIPDDNLAYPVLIILNKSLGSGFFLNTNNNIYLVTAKHVLIDSETGKLRENEVKILSYSKDLTDPQQNLATLDLAIMNRNGDAKWHLMQDVAVLRIAQLPDDNGKKEADQQKDNKRFNGRAAPGVTFVQIAKLGLVGVSLENTRNFKDALIGNDVIVFGYPNSLGLPKRPQFDSLRPLLRKGMIAGLNPQAKSIILDCELYPGNSGGPVIQVEERELFIKKFNVVGVVSEYIPFRDEGKMQTFSIVSNSGYSVAVPMDFVLELINIGR